MRREAAAKDENGGPKTTITAGNMEQGKYARDQPPDIMRHPFRDPADANGFNGKIRDIRYVRSLRH